MNINDRLIDHKNEVAIIRYAFHFKKEIRFELSNRIPSIVRSLLEITPAPLFPFSLPYPQLLQ
jgi:hypothetical protein